jgi:TatD DNase family protein
MDELFDTHAHLGLESYYKKDLESVIQRAREVGVRYIATVGIDLTESRKAVRIASDHSDIFAIVGVHPHEAKGVTDSTLEEIAHLARHEKVVAYGEIGLDFYRNRSPKHAQIAVFREQIRLARSLKLPIVIHDRDAHEETVRILKEEKADEVGGIIHCFSGDLRMAWDCIAMGFLISIPGTVTFKKARQVHAVVRGVPLDYLLVETDCPYLTPVPHRGKRNEPAYVRHTAEAVAALKELPLKEVAAATTRNAIRIFGLGESNDTTREHDGSKSFGAGA